MTYNVLMGTLNPTHSLTQSIIGDLKPQVPMLASRAFSNAKFS